EESSTARAIVQRAIRHTIRQTTASPPVQKLRLGWLLGPACLLWNAGGKYPMRDIFANGKCGLCMVSENSTRREARTVVCRQHCPGLEFQIGDSLLNRLLRRP